MLGGILAYLVRQPGEWLAHFRTQRAAGGLLLIGVSIFALNGELAFPGYWALFPTVGAFLVISAGFTNWNSRYVLGNRLMVGVGLISYPLYLWHWPILVFAKIVKGGLLTPTDRITAIVASVALAFLTYRFVEYPIRHSAASRMPQSFIAQGLAAAMAAAGALGLLIFTGAIDSRLRNEDIAPILAASYDWQYPPVAAENHSFGELRYFRESSKLDSYTLFAGDSNMEQYAPRIDRVIKDNAAGVNGAIMVGNQQGCNFLIDIVSGVNRCPSAFVQLKALINADSTIAVAFAESWINNQDALSNPDNQQRFVRFLRSIADKKRVYLILNIPNGAELAPKNMFAGSRLHEITARPVASISFDFGGFEQRYAEINKILAAIAEQSGATLIDPIPYLCPQAHCPVFDADGRPLYLDSAHLTRSYAMRAATYIDATLAPSNVRKEGRAQ
jgi:hypothetical protein